MPFQTSDYPAPAAIANPDALPLEEPPAARPRRLRRLLLASRRVLRVGRYRVGACFCPHLYGHPGIRY